MGRTVRRREETMTESDESIGLLGPSAPARQMEYLGLCTTCEAELTCTFWRSPDQPVLHCEEFTVYALQPEPTGADRQ